GAEGTTAATAETVYTSTSTGENGVVTTYITTAPATGATATGTAATGATGASTVAAGSTSTAAATATPAVSTAFNGAGKIGASVAMFALPLAYFL
ncbi:hypothetical protein OXX79_003778, partial [Metschnikowia pulcherrima]